MTGILDSIITKPRAFYPESVAEYTALQLARKLGAPDVLWNYLPLFDRYPFPLIVQAFVNARGRTKATDQLASAFEEEIGTLTQSEDQDGL